MSVTAVIVAGGRGARMGADRPKQLLPVGGRTLLERSVAAFDAHPGVDAIVVVLPSELVADAAGLVGAVSTPWRAVAGGPRRQDSVQRGAEAAPSGTEILLVHDAARPFVSAAVIDRVIEATRASGVAVPGLPARDTLKQVAADGGVVATIPRAAVWLAQTPQGVRADRWPALAAVAAGAEEATDEGRLAELAGVPVRMVAGEDANVKITTPEDLARARGGATMRVGTGYDLHRLVAGRPLVLAGLLLPSATGPLGHSDGDVLCHALADALFGAAGQGDIGRHFPNTDPRWKDAPGLDLLARAVAIVAEAGYRPASADVTIVLEQPKLSPHVEAIRARIADVLGVPVDAVSVKGKTNEGVDAVGRGEAIAAHAVAVLTGRLG